MVSQPIGRPLCVCDAEGIGPSFANGASFRFNCPHLALAHVTTYSDAEERWFAELRPRVVDYIARQGATHGRIGEIPAWFVDPYVSIWAVESRYAPGRVGWWVICGDCPTDYVQCTGDRTARSAVEAIVVRWREGAAAILRGAEPVEWTVGNLENRKMLAELLARRAALLDEWTRDDELWT